MKDLEFGHAAGDPLPERLKQYLSDMARRELDRLRADLEAKLMALERALARPDQHDSLETLVLDLARAATIEAEAAASRAMLEMPARQGAGATDAGGEPTGGPTVVALQNELEDLRRRSENDTARMQIERAELADKLAAAEREAEAVRQLLSSTQRDIEEVRRNAREARQAADVRAADLAKAREAAGAAQVEAAARVKTLEDKVKAAEAARAEAERIRRDAVSRADAAEVFAREMAARASNAEAWGKDLETRLKETEARYGKERETSAEREKQHAESMAGRVSDRDALAERVARQQEMINRLETTVHEYEQQLAAADERHKSLELQLFQRGTLEPSRDEDLSGLLTMSSGVATRPSRIATRYAVGGAVRVEIGGHAGLLVDLSTYGAQVLTSAPLDEGVDVEVRLVSDELAAACRGRIVWTKLEPDAAAGSQTHRAGIAFTYRDVSAVEAFIIRYAST